MSGVEEGMTEKEIQEFKKLIKELNKMRDIIETVDNRLFHTHMTIWRKIMDRREK